MDALLDMLGAGASVASGGLFGVIGAIGSSILKGKQRSAAHQHQLELREQDRLDARSGHLAEIHQRRQQASTDGMSASIRHDEATLQQAGQGVLGQWAVFIKATYRPLLTTVLVGATCWVFVLLLGLVRGTDQTLAAVIDVAVAVALIDYLVRTLVFTTSTAVVWWYGERAITPRGEK